MAGKQLVVTAVVIGVAGLAIATGRVAELIAAVPAVVAILTALHEEGVI